MRNELKWNSGTWQRSYFGILGRCGTAVEGPSEQKKGQRRNMTS